VTIACTSTWEAVQNDVGGKIGTKRYNLWIKHTALKSIDEETAVVGVPNLFIQAWLEKKFRKYLEDSLRHVVGRQIALRFTVDGSLFRQMRLSQDEAGVTPLISRPKASAIRGSALNPRYTLKRFVVGECNRFACEMARTLARTKSRDLNPLFIYGPVGIGKTHLLQGFAAEYKGRHPNEGVTYVTCEQFVNQFVSSIQRGCADSFRSLYRNTDVLVVDDVQWLSGKKGSQQEFLHTFNALTSRDRLVVMAGNSYPREITATGAAVLDRLASGITARIDPPDYNTRLGIIRTRAAELKRHVPEGVAQLLAKRFAKNVRELEGGLLKVLAFHSLLKKPLNERSAAEILRTERTATGGRTTLETVVEAVAGHFGLSPQDITSKRRTRSLCLPRHIAMYLARRGTTYSLKEIGEHFGGRSHAAVLHAMSATEKRTKSDPTLGETIRSLQDTLGLNETQ